MLMSREGVFERKERQGREEDLATRLNEPARA